ncbi:MAG: hypothetical protein OHK0012_12220 [Synechococcales cyanobacterium]
METTNSLSPESWIESQPAAPSTHPTPIDPVPVDTKVAAVVATLTADYAHFPHDQTYGLYAPDVQFRDPVNQMQGREHFRRMIGWMTGWFRDLKLDLHHISAQGSRIETRWTMSWIAPLPWQPPMVVTGRSEFEVNEQGLIASQTDYWDCTRWQLFRQIFQSDGRN